MSLDAVLEAPTSGDEKLHRELGDLRIAVHDLPPMPSDRGRVALIVRRPERGRRETPDRVLLTPEEGIPGEAWNRKESATTETQISVMQTDIAGVIANGQALALFGDNLFLDLDVSDANLPPGTRVRIGKALLEVTAKKHKGCVKFSGRFGVEALRFVATPEGRARNFRGLFMRVLSAGEAGPGDEVQVVERPAPGSAD